MPEIDIEKVTPIARAAGGAGKRVYQYQSKKELLYNKKSLVNEWFIVK